MLLTVFALPAASLPPQLGEFAPDGVRPVVLGGHAMAGVALVDYAPGSVVTYNELLVSFLTREGRKLGVHALAHLGGQPAVGGRRPRAVGDPEGPGASSSATADRPRWTWRAGGPRR